MHPHHYELINNFYSWKWEKEGEEEVLFGWTLGNVVKFDPLTTVKSGSDSCYLFEKAALSGIPSYVCGRIGWSEKIVFIVRALWDSFLATKMFHMHFFTNGANYFKTYDRFFNGFCCSCEQLARHVFRRLKALATVFGADVSQMSLYVRSSRKFEVAGKALCLLFFFLQ